MKKYKDFCDDEEKMSDFRCLTKQDFLKSYSYLTEEEYNLTRLAMKRYRLGIWEEISGYIAVEAESKEKAKEMGEELINERGVEECLFPTQHQVHIMWSKHCHGDRTILDCEEIKEEQNEV